MSADSSPGSGKRESPTPTHPATKPIKLIGALAALAAAVAVTVSAGRPAAMIALIVVVLAVMIAGTTRQLQRNPDDRRKKMAIAGCWTLVVAAAIAAAAIPASRSLAVYDIIGFARTPTISIDQIQVLEGREKYRLIASVDNHMAADELVTSVGLAVATGPGIDTCSGATPYRLIVGNTIRITRYGSHGGHIKVPVFESKQPGFHVMATGTVSGLCLTQSINLAFATGIQLPARQLSDIVIELPQSFTVVRNESEPSTSVQKGPTGPATIALPVDPPGATGFSQPGYVSVELGIGGYSGSIRGCHTVLAGSGAITSACR